MKAEKLFEILGKDLLINSFGTMPEEVTDIIIDSRKAKPKSCFVAIKGTNTDGHQYIDDVVSKGVGLVVCQDLPLNLNTNVCYIQVLDSKKAAGLIAHQWAENPSQNATVIGVTGTNGKTTVATLLYQLYTALGYPCGLISTVENIIKGRVLTSTHTTPDAIALAALMKEMVDEGCEYIFMEVSSHALDQERVSGIKFKAALFTNITHDHLDYHVTFMAYIQAKKKFFDQLEKNATAIVNLDDRNGNVMVQNTKAKVVTFGLHSLADYRCKVLSNDITGLHIRINQFEVVCAMSGEFNAYNLLTVFATAVEMGEEKEKVLGILSGLQGAEGRMQKVLDAKSGKTGVVDYAHTPDALENVLKTLKASVRKPRQIITVVGCGGDRDKTKRPVMARIAAEWSDKVVFTSDNPRSEDPETILNDMAAGLTEEMKPRCLRVADRANAIKTAVALAQPGDVVLVAGKGHEKYQEIKGKKFPFEDKKILLEIFEGTI